MDERFRLIPEDIPPITKATVYERVMEEFLACKDGSCRVDVPKKKPATIHQGLLKMKRVHPRYADIGVVRRGDAIYLRK